jgi:hypothetical protein
MIESSWMKSRTPAMWETQGSKPLQHMPQYDTQNSTALVITKSYKSCMNLMHMFVDTYFKNLKCDAK